MNESVKHKSRIYKWDNAKAFLMLLVVWGHFSNEYARPADGDVIMKGISIFIYLFHMPAFIFLAGLFTKPYDDERPFNPGKAVSFIFLGYLLKILIFLIKTAFGKEPVFHLFSDTGLPWYMFAMAAFMVLTWLLRNVNPRIVVPFSIIAACLAGYFNQIESFLYLSRILVFFPYFYLGYLADPVKTARLLSKKPYRILSVLILSAALLVIIFHTRTVYGSIRLFTGRNPYSRMSLPYPKAGAFFRLLSYFISVILGLSVFCLMPDKEIPVAGKVGSRTLQIYFWHRLIIYLLVYSGAKTLVVELFPVGWRLICLTTATGLCILLSSDIFAFPVKAAAYIEKTVSKYFARSDQNRS